MAEYGIVQRFVKVSQDEIGALSKLEGQRFVEVDGIRRSVTIHLWQGRNEQRLYVRVDGDSSYVVAAANQDEFGFSSPISGRAVVALLETKQAAEEKEEEKEVEIEAESFVAPTAEEVEVAYRAVFGAARPTDQTEGNLALLIDKSEGVEVRELSHDSPEIRRLQVKTAWQNLVVAPIFKALPVEEQRPYRWDEICMDLEDEWKAIEMAANSGLVSWADHVAAFRQGMALRAI